MLTLLHLLDLAVLLLLIVHLLRAVGSFGSAVLSALVGFFVILFSIVSLGAFAGLITESSIGIQVIFLVILLVMGLVVLSSWKQTARPT